MKKSYLIFSLLIFAFTAAAQEQPGLSPDSAIFNFGNRMNRLPQEKIYLQTDKPYYISGEKVWFRIHLTDARLHYPVQVDKYVYTELINPLDSVVVRLKVRRENDIFQGHITLPEDLPEGNYKLRAYTNYMRNAGEDYFFTKQIFTGTPQSAFIRTISQFDFEGNKKVTANIRFVDVKQNTLYLPEKLTVKLNNEREKVIKPDKEGTFRFDFNLLPDARRRVIYAKIEYNGKLFEQYISVPYPEDAFNVSFFPEGGYLVPDMACKTAFKALQPGGLHVNVTGKIFDNNDNYITELGPSHAGMGLCMFVPDRRKTYYAVCENEKGYAKRFELPLPQEKVYALSTNWIREKLWISVKQDTANNNNEILYLIAHVRGKICYAGDWNPAREYISIGKENFPAGVMHILLLNSSLKPVSERLVFVDNAADIALSNFKTEKTEYGKRDLIRANLQITDTEEIPMQGYCAVSVTDDGEVVQDTTHNILTSLLLASDLKGHIENPAYYFQKNNKKAQSDLDVLMMTQGWRRYDIDNLFQKTIRPAEYPLEIGPEISGIVKGGLLSKPYENATVSIISMKNHFDVTKTDKNGRFYFRNIELPDSTRIIVQALSKRGNDRVELYLDPETFPPVTIPGTTSAPIENKDIFREYIHKAERKYTIENGIRIIHLEQVEVTAKRERKYTSPYYSYANNTLTEKQIEESGITDIKILLMRIPGIVVNGSSISIRGSLNNPLLLVDNVVMDFEYLDMMNIFEIAQIDVIKDGTSAIFGSRGGNGIISIHTKTGDVVVNRLQFNMAKVTPLGYHRPTEFYSPKYETTQARENPTPDLRTTLYWNPNIIVNETGEASFEFYSADSASDYSVNIEGLSDKGKIIRYVGKIKRTSK